MSIKAWIGHAAVALALLCATAVAGAQLSAPAASEPQDAPKIQAQEYLDNVSPKAGHAQLSLGIFARNLTVYLLLLGGLACAGITTIFVLAFNGFMIGQILVVAHGAGVAPDVLAWVILPHGLLELGCLLFAAAIGLRGPALLAAWANGKSASHPVKLLRMAAAGCAALAVAALIEAYWTIPIARLALSS